MVSTWPNGISSVSTVTELVDALRSRSAHRGYRRAVLYHHPTRQQQAVAKANELKEREEALAEEKKKLGMTD